MILTFVLGLIGALVSAMVRPGVNITVRSAPASRSTPTATGTWFVCGLADQGPITPVLITSLNDFVTWFGNRVSYSVLYDAIDLFFREGGGSAYVSRVVGPAATTGTKNLLDSGSGVSLVVSAIGPGASSANLKVGVVAGTQAGTFQIQVTDTNNVVLEQSSDLADQAAAVNWGKYSQYIRIALGVTTLNPAVVAASVLSTGTDDRASITDTQWQAALDRFTRDLGPGQVSYPGRTTTTAWGQLTQHANDRGRVAILDAPDTSTVATHTAQAAAARSNGRWGGVFAPWLVLPGVVPNTLRTVPPSGFIAGRINQNDLQYSASRASAGTWGQSNYALDLSQPAWDATNRQTLNGQGINVIRNLGGVIQNYGWRSLADPNADPFWVGLENARVAMALSALGNQVLDAHMFDDIDGGGKLFKTVEGELIAVCSALYTLGDLYGTTPGEAFQVVCDTSNNTPTTIANHELHASIAFRVSEFAEMIQLDLVKVPVTQPVG